MPSIYFTTIELIMYALFALCLRHAWQKGPTAVLKLLIGAAFGVLLELATIRQLNAYQYGQFLIMVWDVPLCVGVSWGCIIYSAMEFSDASSLPYWTRPLLDGLLALFAESLILHRQSLQHILIRTGAQKKRGLSDI